MKRPFLSIVTVTYNAAKYLEETLESVASQTFQDFEHIIWDGGSQDGTLQIAKKYHVSIYSGQDKGIADAMNKGAFFAKGKFLLHLHADDFLAQKSSLEMAALHLKQHPQAKWLYGRAHIVDSDSNILRTTPYESFSPKRLRKYNFITHPTVFLETEFFRTVQGFKENLRYAMDYDLWLRLSRLSQPLVLSAVLACFREHSDSLSTSEPLKVAHETYRVRNVYVENLFERVRSYMTWKKRLKKIINSR